MKTFHCTHCQHLVFFENISCLNCGHSLAYLPDRNLMAEGDQGGDGHLRHVGPGGRDEPHWLCANYDRENVCNWAVLHGDPAALCRSCRLTRLIPDRSQPGNATAWYRLEVAAAAVGLSLRPKRADEPAMATPANPFARRAHDFDRMVEDWLPLTCVLNNLNRGLGLADSYPFVLSAPVIGKLRFIHDTIYGGR